jgi:hypothetical protein
VDLEGRCDKSGQQSTIQAKGSFAARGERVDY